MSRRREELLEIAAEMFSRHGFAVDHQALISVHFHDLNHARPDDQRRVRLLQRQYVEIWVGALMRRDPGLTPDIARPAVHAGLGLINSTPFSQRTERGEMVDLLCSMAGAAFAAVTDRGVAA